jgi:hypothetical protein
MWSSRRPPHQRGHELRARRDFKNTPAAFSLFILHFHDLDGREKLDAPRKVTIVGGKGPESSTSDGLLSKYFYFHKPNVRIAEALAHRAQ